MAGLRLATRQLPDAPFIAAGAPWYFTLFGRDSLWAARLLLPLDTGPDNGLAAGTLRALAAFQGTRTDAAAAEEPGKILHELRSKELVLESQNLRLPPVYFGAVDSTPLWLCLLGELWRTGRNDDAVRSLLPNAARAAEWLLAAGASGDGGDGDGAGNGGFLSYRDSTGHGLSNQGWKDSRDAMQFSDGRPGRRANRPVRGAGLRVPGSHGDGGDCSTPSGNPAARRCGTSPRPSGSGSVSASGLRTTPGRFRPWPWTGTGFPSTSRARTWDTCWARASWIRPKPGLWRTGW